MSLDPMPCSIDIAFLRVVGKEVTGGNAFFDRNDLVELHPFNNKLEKAK